MAFGLLATSSGLQAEEGTYAIVIDDLAAYGYRFPQRIAPLLVLNERDVPISYAIMPNLPETRRVGQELDQRDVDYLIHFPMEAFTIRRKPGEKRLAVTMDRKEIRNLLLEALDQLPNAIGLNNHQGSLCTSDSPWMENFLEEMNSLGLNFLDSGTVPGGNRCRTPEGKKILASELCQINGICPRIRVLSQNLWLDDQIDYLSDFAWVPSSENPASPDIQKTCDTFFKLHRADLELAQDRIKQGCQRRSKGETVIAIGHPKWATICGLRRFFYSEKNREECPITSLREMFQN